MGPWKSHCLSGGLQYQPIFRTLYSLLTLQMTPLARYAYHLGLFSIGRQMSHTLKYLHVTVPRVRREFVHSFLVGCVLMLLEQKNRLVG